MEKILIIDDDADLLELIGIILPKHGFVVQKIINGRDAIKEAGIFKPDLILLDLKVSGDGKEICKQLKSPGSLFENVPVILFSGAGDIEKQMAGCKADGFIQKPFDLLRLVEKIRQHTTFLARSENAIS